MVSDPKALAYALIDSYLQFRAKGKWLGYIKLDEVTPHNLETINDLEIRQKVECCIETVRFISQVINDDEYFGLVYFFADQEQKQLSAANEKKSKFPFLLRPFINGDPVAAQLERALGDLFLEYLEQMNLLKPKKDGLEANLKYNQELQKLQKTPEVERDIKNLDKQIDLLTQQNCHKKFYNDFIKNDETAKQLQENTWQKFDLNVMSKARKSSFCERIVGHFPNPHPKVIEPEIKQVVEPVTQVITPEVANSQLNPVPPAASVSTAAIYRAFPKPTRTIEEQESQPIKRQKSEAPPSIAATRPRRATKNRKADPSHEYSNYRNLR